MKQLNLPDHQKFNEKNLKTAILFLNEIGTIVHPDLSSYGLTELFIDPGWLCDIVLEFNRKQCLSTLRSEDISSVLTSR